MSLAHPQGDPRSTEASEVSSLRARIEALEREVQAAHDAERASRLREQQLTTHNLVLVNLSRSTAIEEGDIRAAFEQITVAAAHTLDVERASIWMFTPDRSEIRCLDLYQRSEDRHGNGLELKASDYPSYFHAIEDNRTLAADEARTDARTCEFTPTYLTPLGITSMLDAPVRRGGRLIGVICHEHTGPPRKWTLEDQAFAGSMADFVSMTLQAHDREQALRLARTSEKQLRQVIDLVPHMILAKDGHGRMVLANKAMAEAYGVAIEHLIGRSQWEMHPQHDEVARMLSDDLRVLEAGREQFIAEEGFTDSRGQRHILQTTKIPFMLAASREPAVLGVSIDITRRIEDERLRELMIQELDHRVKNNLAVVQSIAEQTARSSPSMDVFADAFFGRLRALAITHEMLAGAKWEGADLRGMAERLIEPYRTPGRHSRVTVDGEALRLPPSLAPSICMIVHELATNAAKHGALSRPDGRVLLSWHREMRGEGEHRSPWLHLEWAERGGPPARRPARQGFGTNLIEQTVTYQLRGRASLDFASDGLKCVIDLPLERPSRSLSAPALDDHEHAQHDQPHEASKSSVGEAAHALGHPRRVLVVEDDLLVAQSLASHLRSLGCEVIGPAATSDDACALVKSSSVDAAILDINLSAGTSAPVARALAGRRTPFAFVTGYSSIKTLPDDLRGHRVLCKPVDRETLGRALEAMAFA